MRAAYLGLALAGAAAIGLSACSQKREATADTGTAKATVSTEAPPSKVPDAQLQSQAQQAATASSTPVDGSGPVNTTTAVPPTSSNSAPAKK
jgi:Zn-dependent protease with chaperone function